jgi:hypothetical protein
MEARIKYHCSMLLNTTAIPAHLSCQPLFTCFCVRTCAVARAYTVYVTVLSAQVKVHTQLVPLHYIFACLQAQVLGSDPQQICMCSVHCGCVEICGNAVPDCADHDNALIYYACAKGLD